MRAAAIAFLLSLLVSTAALAADAKDFPFREDSGLSKAEYLLLVGKYSAALESADEVLKRRPSNADALTYRGYAYYKLGQHDMAQKDFQEALKLKPTHLGANKYLADIYLDNGKMQQAIEQMQVIRMACGKSGCAELEMLAGEIDAFKKLKETPAAPADKK